MKHTIGLYAAALGIDLNGIIEHETNKAKYRAADRQASYHEKNSSVKMNTTAPTSVPKENS